MSFYDGLNEYATTKRFVASSYSALENILISETDAAVSTVFTKIFEFYSALNGAVTLTFLGATSDPGRIVNFDFEVRDNGTPVTLSFTSASRWKYVVLPLVAGHTYAVKAKNNMATSQINVYLNGTITEAVPFFIKKL